ncbi:uncharacterized protein BX664DRAFT_325070 [Halteromyces radiatus]|uniref:uncharacterized protein n=1 Tax=Halteromyces radiatus TaxID=101107 RepID=UPI00221EA183|nr:uncharacterized protein BX664DRAFT_325070 [Halteromyces radiatus]KAI8096867.1 hypothetical protein BX664DRAFT_325070 [Halteromyces radiatus]
MASVFNETTQESYPLIPNVPLILGRKHVDRSDQRVSRAHVQITLLDDQRCFVKALSTNLCTLDNAILPKKLNQDGNEEGEEIEAFNSQWIHLLPGQLYPFRLDVPKVMTIPTPRKPLLLQQDENDGDHEDIMMDSSQEKEQQEDKSEDDWVGSNNSSIISTESSLLGSEEWSE